MKKSKSPKLTTKAGKVKTDTSLTNPFTFEIMSGKATTQVYDAEALTNLNGNFASICNVKIANTLASVPLKLYYHNKGKTIKATPYKKLLDPAPIIKALNIKVASDEEIVEIIEHPVLSLLDEVKPNLNGFDLKSIISQYLGIIGNSYVEIVRDDEGLVTELHPLLSEYVTVYADNGKDGKILRYEYKVGKKVKVYQPEQIIHFVNYMPGNMIIGKGELELCLKEVALYNEYMDYEYYLNHNHAIPDYALIYKNPLQEKDLKELYKQVDKRWGGIKNSGKPIVMSGDMDIKSLGLAPKDMGYQQGKSWLRSVICATYGVPLSMVTTEDINYANAVAGSNFFLKYTIYPKLVKFCQTLNEQLIKLYEEDGLYIWFEETYATDPKDLYANTVTAYSSGIISRNEARSAIGLEPVLEDSEDESDKEGDDDANAS